MVPVPQIYCAESGMYATTIRISSEATANEKNHPVMIPLDKMEKNPKLK